MRRIRRELLHLLFPQLHTLAKLLLVLLLSTLFLFTYKKARLQNISVSLDAMAKQREIEKTDKVVENDLKTTIPLSVISRTHLEHKTTQLSLSISTKEVVTMATTITSKFKITHQPRWVHKHLVCCETLLSFTVYTNIINAHSYC